MVTPLLAPLPPLKRLRSIATARPGPGLLAPKAIPSSSTSSPTTAPTTTAAPAAIATASSTGTGTSTAHRRSASVAFLDGHHVAPPPPQPPQPSSSPPPSSSSLAPPSRGEEAARHLRGSRRRRRRPRDEDYEDSEYDQDYDYQDDDHDDHEEEEEYDEEEEAPPLMVARVATAPQLPGPAAGFGGGEEEERERRAVERCLDLGVERNVVEALSTAGVSAERIVELILSEDKEQREGIIRGTGLSKNYIMKLQRRALRTSAHLQLPSPLAHSFRSGLVLHVLFDSHDRALFIKKELCRLLNMKGTTFSYWKKKAAVSDIDTSQDFRLMDKCRSIFGGRSTYTLYSAEQMLTILQCMQRSRQKNCFTNVPELTALIASYHPQHHPQQQQPHRFPSSALLPLLPALAGQPHHGSSGLLRAIDAAGDDDDHDDHDHLHEQQQREEEKKKEDEEQEARAEALTAALPLACPAAPDLLSGRTTTPSPPSPAPLTTTSAAAFPGPATDNGHFTAADPR
ncbi:uncharacterized protein ACA1_151270 [Acanthamoeba castellanii str. Neff]|uniref:Uncharacterized protein n=1 Tax=Acanthamoeba castellanii (strain ATCC 30010 / Neff) TaxID=1257118 RepID=L8GZX1_ACACF|nr:uncharacterized protein ACA1_151270 [Acanthamoeba castellanii str. Neff]ELR18814.1 hypothetical protein ACA1_151270 [Acanthamoeba castellanii str. Neff]